jgi:hypothetical protein
MDLFTIRDLRDTISAKLASLKQAAQEALPESPEAKEIAYTLDTLEWDLRSIHQPKKIA